jgi:hypothetical protein
VSIRPSYIAPWSPDAEDLIRGALGHTFTVKIYPSILLGPREYLPITVTGCTLTYDEFWSPYVQGELVADIPDADTLAALDPRGLVRVDVSAGYMLPGGVQDVHPMAYCFLSARTVDYPANELRLQFQGFEYVFDQAIATTSGESPIGHSSGGPWTSSTTVSAALDDIVDTIRYSILWVAADVVFDDDIGARTGWVDPGEPWAGAAGDNPLSMGREIADRVDGWFRCDELGRFRMGQRDWTVNEASHRLRVGADGTIISSSDAASREQWANRAYVQYDWSVLTTSGGTSTAVRKTASGSANLDGSPYDASLVGAVVVTAARPWAATNGQAAQAAKALLRRHSVRSTALQVAGVAAYWLRPPDGVSVELPVGPQLQLTISAVTFDLTTGRMDIRTRNPEPGLAIGNPNPV